ncbi:MAG TPA: hypothetical protein PLC99_13285 [Verrucomicrobiota bacterium]|nr:hypothetical protein [Verrucomicrobiota bacterium]
MSSVTVLLPDGREIQLNIVNQRGILGGQVLLFACPTCGPGPAGVLRIA